MGILKNKKGSGFADVYVIFVFLFIMFIVGGISIFTMNTFNSAWQGTGDEVSETSKTEGQAYTSLFQGVLDGGLILWLVILWLGSLVTAFFLDNSPVFYIIFFLGGLISLFGLLPLASLVTALESTALGGAFGALPMATFVMNNLLIFITAFLITNGLALYAKFKVLG